MTKSAFRMQVAEHHGAWWAAARPNLYTAPCLHIKCHGAAHCETIIDYELAVTLRTNLSGVCRASTEQTFGGWQYSTAIQVQV